MSSFVITDADRGPDGKIILDTPFSATPDEAPRPPANRPAADQHIAAFLPAVPAAPDAPSAPAPSRRVQLAGGALLVIVALLGWFAWLRPSDAPTPARPTLPATAAPAVAASAPSAAPTAAPGCALTRAAATFYAPAGDATGDALDPGTVCRLVAWHSGFADWRQISVGSGAPIWVRASVLSIAATVGLPDLAPPPTPTPAPPPPATARPVIIVVTPTPCEVPAYTTRIDNVVDGLTIGYAVGVSCESQADADAQAQALSEQATASYRATHPRR